MIKLYWDFLYWLVDNNLYYLSVVIHIIACFIGIVVFALVVPFFWAGDRITEGCKWLKLHFKNGLNELKKGKK
jgi:hypothetical protein